MGNNTLASAKPIGPGEIIGPYTIVRRVPGGVGGMATVYEALQAGTNLRVALKIANEGKGSFLRDEAAFMRAFKLHHPHIIKLIQTPIGGGQQEYILRDPRSGAWYFAMEYLAGGSLSDWLERRKRLPLASAIETARQAALALEASHNIGLVHLDVKPSNILFRQPPEKPGKIEAVLTDFGISRPQVRATTGSDMTSLTVEYASPEQAQRVQQTVTVDPNEAANQSLVNIGPASDLYSLATILYEMVSGQLPFPMQSHDDLVYLHKIVYDPPALPLSNVPPELNAVLARALHKDPVERYPSARAFADDLAHIPVKGKTVPERKTNGWVLGLAGVALGFAAGFMVGQSQSSAQVVIAPTATIAPASDTAVNADPLPTLILADTPTPEATTSAAPINTNVPPTSTRKPTNTPVPIPPTRIPFTTTPTR